MMTQNGHCRLGFRICGLALVCACLALAQPAAAQQPASTGEPERAASRLDPSWGEDPLADALPADEASSLSLLELLLKGGYLMVPIAGMSVAVVMLVIERGLALRRRRVLPHGLVQGLAEIHAVPGVLDPRRAYRLCQNYPSATATVVRAMLLKIGRPQAEIEQAVGEASQREASRLYSNVRWLHLAAAVTPLMGLFGTVWGMIRAFFDTTQLPVGQNKADYLAQGIYVALVTTLGGLAVAIPAAIFAHYFEVRIQRLFHQIEELLFHLLPQVERFEGRIRVTERSLGGDGPLQDEYPATEPKPAAVRAMS